MNSERSEQKRKLLSVEAYKNHWSAAVRGGRRVRPSLDPLVVIYLVVLISMYITQILYSIGIV